VIKIINNICSFYPPVNVIYPIFATKSSTVRMGKSRRFYRLNMQLGWDKTKNACIILM
jgi:hypothetical protein